MLQHPVPPEPLPDELEIAKKVRNLLVLCPYISLEVAIEYFNATDIEGLIFNMMMIEDFKRGNR